MKNFTILFSLIIISQNIYSQNVNYMTSAADSNDYYYEIPPYPDSYSAENVAARMVDGLGFRFYWATEGLHQTDLEFRPSEDGRTTEETLDHLYGLSLTIINATLVEVNEGKDRSGMSTDDKRRMALENMKMASENLKKADSGDIENMKSIFKRGEGTAEYPFWNMINGPIADAIYHTGQIVTFRRSSGNPINPNITVFMGRVRN
jgi:hypothetical protein